jgi:hypothetical protein
VGPQASSITDPSAAILPYAPDVPGLPKPSNIVATRADELPPVAREIGWAYNDPAVGRYVIVESAVDYTKQALASQAAGTPGCTTRSLDPKDFGPGASATTCVNDVASIVKIRGGTEALLMADDSVTSLMWIEPIHFIDMSLVNNYANPALEVRIAGPAEELTPTEAIAIANQV